MPDGRHSLIHLMLTILKGVECFNIKELSNSLDLLGLDDTESLISIPRIALIRTEKELLCTTPTDA